MGILSYFDPRYSPRDGQKYVLKELETNWNRADVFVLLCPVAAGKSLIGDCIARWVEHQGNTCGLFTPTNTLVNQYLGDLEGYESPPKRARYRLPADWDAAKARYKSASRVVGNYYNLLSLRAYKTVQVFDEAHTLIPTLQQMEEVTLWEHQHPWPENLRTAIDVLCWAVQFTEVASMREVDPDPKMAKLVKLLERHETEYTITTGTDLYRGKPRQYLKVTPLTPRDNAPILWPPSRAKKIVLMSATLNEEDLYDLGLDRRRVHFIESPSPIPTDRRPVKYTPIGSGAYWNKEQYLAQLKQVIESELDQRQERGFIHMTYDMARSLRDIGLDHPRLVWHSSLNAQQQYERWRAGHTDGDVFVGCGYEQGIDLKGDIARWQLVCKIQYPDKKDPAVAAKLQYRPEWYSWCAARHLLQASGRVCRGPDDYGETLILDSQFGKLYSKHTDMMPSWFQSALG